MAEELLLTHSSRVWKFIGHRGQTDIGIKHLYHGNHKNISTLLLKQGSQRWAGPAVGCTLVTWGPLQSPRGEGGDLFGGRAHRWDCLSRTALQNSEWEWNFWEFKCLLYLAQERGGEGSDASAVPGAGAASSKISPQYLRKTFAALCLAVISAVIKGLAFSRGIWCPHRTLSRKLVISFWTWTWAVQSNGYPQQLDKGLSSWATWEQRRWSWLAWWGPRWQRLHWVSLPIHSQASGQWALEEDELTERTGKNDLWACSVHRNHPL